MLQEAPDVILNIVDASNLGRNLFFTTQLLELGIPMVVALNKSDVLIKKEGFIDVAALSRALGCPVIRTVSTTGQGLQEVISTAISQLGTIPKAPYTPKPYNLQDEAAVRRADQARFAFVHRVVEQVEQISQPVSVWDDKLDDVLTNPIFGIPIFAAVMFLVFQISQVWVGTPIADWLVAGLEGFQSWVGSLFVNANPLLSALLVDGMLGGVIAVVGFLPLVMVMYFLIALLEDCGYMARVAVVLDPIFKKVGLSGRSVIPFVITIGCAVPGIMASRTIRNDRDRKATVMLAPFMPCGAKIPVISLFAGAFFDNAGWVSTVMYLSGIALIFLGALLVRAVAGAGSTKSYFLLELPEYKLPSVPLAFHSMVSRGWSYIVKAATIILLCNTAVQLMQSFTWGLVPAQTADASILASIAAPFAWVLYPIVGVVSWQLAAAAVTGFIAKENVVGTLAVCFVGLENLIDTEALEMIEGAGGEVAGIMAISKAAALAYLMFNLYTPPCFAAIGAMNAELKEKSWLLGGIALQLGIGYTVGYLVYTIGTLLTLPSALDPMGALAGLCIVLAFAAAAFWLARRNAEQYHLI